MERPKLFPEDSIATQTTRRLTSIGIVLYTLYLIPFTIVAFILLDPPTGLNAALDQLFNLAILILLIIIDILLPLRLLRKLYANGLTRFRSLTTLIFPTLTGIRLIFLAPLAIYNIILVAYFYYQINNSSTDTTTNTTTKQKSSNKNTANSPSPQRKTDDIEEDA